MSNEITWNVGLTISKGGVTERKAFSGRIDMAGNNTSGSTQDIGTSAEALTFGDIAGIPPQLLLKNLDATNFILVGFTNPPTEIKLKAGEAVLMRPTTATIYAKADTAACRLYKLACEP